MATEIGPSGRKDVREAVLIAALCSVATGLIGWGIEELKKLDAARRKNKKRRKN